MENSKTNPKSEMSPERKTINDENKKQLHNEDQQLLCSSRSSESSILPPNEDLLSWCVKQTTQLDVATKTALTTNRFLYPGNKTDTRGGKGIVSRRAHIGKIGYQVYQNSSNRHSTYEFVGDLHFFEQNRHPSILQMLKISEETKVRYEKVFNRFCELRISNGVVCLPNDICERVSKYFNPKTVYAIPPKELNVQMMRDEFKDFGCAGPALCIGHIHQIADKLSLPPDMVREYYFEWYTNSHRTSDITVLISEEQKLFDQELKHVDEFQTIQADHDYGIERSRYFKVRSIRRIIKRKPDLTVADALILSRLYKFDIKYIQKLIQDDKDCIFIQHSGDNTMHFHKKCIPTEKYTEINKVLLTNDSNENLKADEMLGIYRDSSSTELKHPIKTPINECNANDLVVSQYEDVVGCEGNGRESSVHSSPFQVKSEEFEQMDDQDYDPHIPSDRFPEDFIYFEKNRHPSIQEMIDISKNIGITYRQVFYRFRDFRSAFKEPCPDNDICRKVLKLFAQRTVFKGVLDASSVNTMYELFEHFGHVGKNPDIGYTHLIAEKVDLPAFIVREQYKEWFSTTDELDPVKSNKRSEMIHLHLENEFGKNSNLSYERLVHLANKYGTTQQVVLNFYESYIQSILEIQNRSVKLEKSKEQPLACSTTSSADPAVLGDYGNCIANVTSNPIDHALPFTSQFTRFSDTEPPGLEDDRLYLMDSEATNAGEVDVLHSISNEEKPILRNCFYEARDGSVHNLFKMTAKSYQLETKSENIQKSKKIKFSMKRPSVSFECSPDSKREKSGVEKEPDTASQHTETEDEEIDIVSVDESSKKTEIDELSRTFVQSFPNIYEFPGDFEIFEKNRHPSIQAMIEISQNVGVPYEKVFQRFQHLRKLKDETCVIGDTCQKVELYNQVYSTLNGVLDEKTLNIMHEEFEKLSELGPNLPVGHVHLIMEKVELSWRVVTMQYDEWYAKNQSQKKQSCVSTAPGAAKISHSAEESGFSD